MNLPVVVILSENFLESVWKTVEKPTILSHITGFKQSEKMLYPRNFPTLDDREEHSSHFVHVWTSSVNEDIVQKHSTSLLQDTDNFYRVSLDRLRALGETEAGDKLLSLLNTPLKMYNCDPLKPFFYLKRNSVLDSYVFGRKIKIDSSGYGVSSSIVIPSCTRHELQPHLPEFCTGQSNLKYQSQRYEHSF